MLSILWSQSAMVRAKGQQGKRLGGLCPILYACLQNNNGSD
jgi:hypothetical protein